MSAYTTPPTSTYPNPSSRGSNKILRQQGRNSSEYREGSPARQSILEQDEVYRILNKFRLPSNERPRVVMITDLAKDYDDLLAMLVSKELHSLQLIILLGLIANLYPATERARFARGSLDSLGLNNIPVAIGTDGTPNPRKYPVYEYEFSNADFMPDDNTGIKSSGEKLLETLLRKANDKQVTLLLISSLKDITLFLKKGHRDLFCSKVSNVCMQGAFYVANNTFVPDNRGANTKWDYQSAQYFYTFLQEENIPFVVYGKLAAYSVVFGIETFKAMAKTGHSIGKYIKAAQVGQDKRFYKSSFLNEPGAMAIEAFLNAKTNWYDETRNKPIPHYDEIEKYLTKGIAYDAFAAFHCAGRHVVDAFGLVDWDSVVGKGQSTQTHIAIGVEPMGDRLKKSNIHPKPWGDVLRALFLGALQNTFEIDRKHVAELQEKCTKISSNSSYY
ncbi:hypothetical protein B7494_g4784 [Chlorociboria aeruginascens]|nr:hypothetical protein B7494_g4784 [Chlorociboria aeruginascens]